MPFPNHKGFYDQQPILQARHLVAHRQQAGHLPPFDPPHSLILCFQPSTFQKAVKQYNGRKIKGFLGDVALLRRAEGIAVAGNFGIGAPIVGVLLEEFAVLGIRRCISVGIAGGLLETLAPGDFVVPITAIRDEGTSHHYVPSQPTADSDFDLTMNLIGAIGERKEKTVTILTGVTWTTDAPFRETPGAVFHAQMEGAMAVEMEASALFAVGGHLGLETASALIIADNLARDTWKMPHDMKPVMNSLEIALHAAVATLSA